MSDRFDILVVGAGPAGIAAAVSAASASKRVGLVDDNPVPGGQIWRSGAPLPSAARSLLAQLHASSITRLQGWRVFDSPQPGILRAECGSESRDLAFEKLILATGARELFLPFPGWTLPNVMGAGGLDAMVRGGLPIAGKRVVVAGTGPLLLAVAAHLARRGAHIAAICEQASARRLAALGAHILTNPAKLMQAFAYRGRTLRAKFLASCFVVAAYGDQKLQSVTLSRNGKQWTEPCDYLACGFHLVPNLELPLLLGCALQSGFVAVDDLLRASVANIYCAGEPTSIGGVELSLLEGRIAGLDAAGNSHHATKLVPRRRKMLGFVRALQQATELNPHLRNLPSSDTLVCRCEDVSFAALQTHPNWRDAKLHTRCGMGPCQGRICGAATAFLFGWNPLPSHSPMRPPIFPVRLDSLASRLSPAQPERQQISIIDKEPQ